VSRIETENQQLKAKIYDAHQKEQDLLAQLKQTSGGGAAMNSSPHTTQELIVARDKIATLEKSLADKERQNQELAEIANSLLAKLDNPQ